MKRSLVAAFLRSAVNILIFSLPAVFLILSGCSGDSKGNQVMAKAGKKTLTWQDIQTIAGVPAESLSAGERWHLVESWVEGALAEQEGKHRGFEKDPAVVMRMNALRAEIYRNKLASAISQSNPTETEIAKYYDQHRTEFLRPVDAYMLELYWAERQEVMTRFRNRLQQGDTSMVTSGDVTFEGKWLLESGEADADFMHELASLKSGEVTFARPYEDGYRVAKLVEVYPAGVALDLSAVHGEVMERMMIEQNRKRMDSLMSILRLKYPVKIYLKDSL